MKGRLGTLAMLTAVVSVALLAFPGSAGAAGQFGDVQGVPFDLPQFSLQQLTGATGGAEAAPPLDLIGEEVATCRDFGFGRVCRLTQVAGTRAGRGSGVPEVVAVAPLVSLPVRTPEQPVAGPHTRGCNQGVCPVVDPVAPALSEHLGLCTFCSDTHSVGTTSALRLGLLVAF